MHITAFDKELKKFCRNYNIHWDEKNKKWNKLFHNKLKTVFVKDETTSSLPESNNPNFPYLYPFYKNENGRGYYQQKFDGWILGAIPHDRCPYCSNILVKNDQGMTKKFCDTNHRVLYDKLGKKRKELNAKVIWIKPRREQPHDENSPYLMPKWYKDVTVEFSDGTKRPITTKKPKTIKIKTEKTDLISVSQRY